jgi:hypothetical protein
LISDRRVSVGAFGLFFSRDVVTVDSDVDVTISASINWYFNWGWCFAFTQITDYSDDARFGLLVSDGELLKTEKTSDDL